RLLVYPDHMQENLERSYGLVFSARLLLALINTGLSRQDAYEIVQRNAMAAWQRREQFIDILREDPDVTSRLSDEELAKIFDYGYYVRNVAATFERLGL
ncbi:MAG: adenylosuccinate lyase, partial [Dehalococcoidia bacterium]|nr:adenylosuccinate lyase [Dehalococcoidia bacterium]